MSFSVGIVGLPNVGKSTLFKALTKKKIDIGPYPFTTVHPNYGVVLVPDSRLEKIAEIVKPEKVTPTVIEFVDIAGLVKDAHKGEGLGNQFLAQIRNCDAIVEVVRLFENENIEHVEKTLDPKRDIEIIKTEFLMKDLETLEKAILKLEKKKERETQKKLELLKKIREEVARGKEVSQIPLSLKEKAQIKEFQFLTEKPNIFVLNVGSKNVELKNGPSPSLTLNLKLEEEISELSNHDMQEMGLQSSLPKLILSCYKILDLITFYTIAGGKEARAWTIKRGSRAPEAGGVLHSDFKEKFIKAEVINWENLVKIGSWKKAREKGELKIVGRDYIVQDGDVIEFKI